MPPKRPPVTSLCAVAAASRLWSVRAFTLVELLAVTAILAILAVATAPMVPGIFSAQGLSSTAYGVSEVLANARAHAVAHNTYVWVGMAEVDQAASPSAILHLGGTGRVVLSVVASQDGSRIYERSDTISSDWLEKTANGSRLVQISKLLLFDHAHLDGALAAGAPGTGMERPLVDQAFRIGLSGSSSVITFNYPLGAAEGSERYSFQHVIEFDPQGSARTFYGGQATLARQIEVGLRPTKGNIVVASEANQAAIQIGGLSGATTIYRP